MKRLLFLAPIALSACGDDRPRLAMPPIERAEPVAYPAIPEGEVVCDGAPCLSDAQTARVIGGLADALDRANAKLAWLRDFIAQAGK